MTISNESIKSIFNLSSVNDDIVIYNGKFCIYTNQIIRCRGEILYKITEPISVNFKAEIYQYDETENIEELISYEDAKIEIAGYKHMNIQILSVKNGIITGYIDDPVIKSKDGEVDYIQFDIVNMDKIPGKLVEYGDLVYAGRIQFNINQYTIVIDKSYDYNKDLHKELVLKNGSIITHTGRIYKKDFSSFKTKNVESLIYRLSTALSFSCGRYVNIINAFGFKKQDNVCKNTYRSWYKMLSNDYKFVFKWTTTISNYYNFEKYLSLMCKKLENTYYSNTILNIIDWYIEALNGHNLSNNIISIQTALEMLSYVVLVEDGRYISKAKFDSLPANQNIRNFLSRCNIDITIPKHIFINKNIIDNFSDGVELITYYRNLVVHPSKKRKNFYLEFEEMWNIILLGIKYIELSILYIINYRGEYTDRFKDYCFGDVDTVPWVHRNKKLQ